MPPVPFPARCWVSATLSEVGQSGVGVKVGVSQVSGTAGYAALPLRAG